MERIQSLFNSETTELRVWYLVASSSFFLLRRDFKINFNFFKSIVVDASQCGSGSTTAAEGLQ